MLSDPIAITVDGSSKSFARVTSSTEPRNGASEMSVFRTATAEYTLVVREYYIPVAQHGGESRKVEITLLRRNPSTTAWSRGGAGIVLFLDEGANVDTGILQTAMTSFVDATLRGRLLAGEN
jgi:hypothetical protein